MGGMPRWTSWQEIRMGTYVLRRWFTFSIPYHPTENTAQLHCLPSLHHRISLAQWFRYVIAVQTSYILSYRYCKRLYRCFPRECDQSDVRLSPRKPSQQSYLIPEGNPEAHTGSGHHVEVDSEEGKKKERLINKLKVVLARK